MFAKCKSHVHHMHGYIRQGCKGAKVCLQSVRAICTSYECIYGQRCKGAEVCLQSVRAICTSYEWIHGQRCKGAEVCLLSVRAIYATCMDTWTRV